MRRALEVAVGGLLGLAAVGLMVTVREVLDVLVDAPPYP